MIARFDWQQRRLLDSIRLTKPALSHEGWRLLISLTLLFTGWLAYHVLAQPSWLKRLPSLVMELLTLSEIAGSLTLVCIWMALWWRQDKAPVAPSTLATLDVAELYALTPYEFEKYVAELFRQKGYVVTLRGRSGDHGVDLELQHQGGKRAIVQCKRYQKTVGAEIVRELYGTLIHERVAHAFLVTTADISEAARKWAKNKPMTLIDGTTLARVATVLANKSDK